MAVFRFSDWPADVLRRDIRVFVNDSPTPVNTLSVSPPTKEIDLGDGGQEGDRIRVEFRTTDRRGRMNKDVITRNYVIPDNTDVPDDVPGDLVVAGNVVPPDTGTAPADGGGGGTAPAPGGTAPAPTDTAAPSPDATPAPAVAPDAPPPPADGGTAPADGGAAPAPADGGTGTDATSGDATAPAVQ